MRFPRLLLALRGTARPTPHNRLFLLSLRHALTADPAWTGDRFGGDPPRGLKAFALIYASRAASQPFHRCLPLGAPGHASVESCVEKVWLPRYQRHDPHNLVAMLDTWLGCDVAAAAGRGGDLAATLGAIRARVSVLACRQDLYFTPADCAAEAGLIPGAAWLALSPARADVLAFPDPTSLMPLPGQPEVGWVATDLVLEGQPLPQCPPGGLWRQLERAARRGLRFRTGVEAEFFLLDGDGTALADARDIRRKPCCDQLALMRHYPLISERLLGLQELGWGPFQADHEDANGQFEINWIFDDPLATADRHAFFRFLVPWRAEAHGLTASFRPRPLWRSPAMVAICTTPSAMTTAATSSPYARLLPHRSGPLPLPLRRGEGGRCRTGDGAAAQRTAVARAGRPSTGAVSASGRGARP